MPEKHPEPEMLYKQLPPDATSLRYIIRKMYISNQCYAAEKTQRPTREIQSVEANTRLRASRESWRTEANSDWKTRKTLNYGRILMLLSTRRKCDTFLTFIADGAL
jgi:hypothetical protein